MTVLEYIQAIQAANTSEEILSLWSRVASERSLTLSDIIEVHRSCGNIVTDAALNLTDNGERLSVIKTKLL